MAATIEKKPAGLKTQLELPKKGTNKVTMKGLVYEGHGKIELKDIPKPVIEKPTDALVKVIKTTICGTDLGILHGKTPPANPELVNTNTSPMLVKTVWSGKIETQKLIMYHFKLDEILKTYEVFRNAGKEKAMKVILEP